MEANYNWDDLNVGNLNLDHSENFFARKHCKHEKLSLDAGLNISKDFSNVSLNDITLNSEDKENLALSPNVIKTPTESVDSTNLNSKTVNNVPEIKIESPGGCINVHQNEEDLKEEVLNDVESQEDVATEMDKTVQVVRPANLACQWNTQKPIVRIPIAAKGTFAKPIPPPPTAYKYSEVYQKKKEEALRKQLEEEKKMREFHGRPAPNFNAYQEQIKKKKPVHEVTVPVTPQVLRTSRELEEKRKKKIEEYLRQQQRPKFEHRSPKVLEEKPFKPKKNPTVIEPKPFKLHTDKRLQDRKHFDKAIQQTLEEKKRKEEEERKRIEEERIKELRKAATFKARPNPFK